MFTIKLVNLNLKLQIFVNKLVNLSNNSYMKMRVNCLTNKQLAYQARFKLYIPKKNFQTEKSAAII